MYVTLSKTRIKNMEQVIYRYNIGKRLRNQNIVARGESFEFMCSFISLVYLVLILEVTFLLRE